MKKTSIVVTTIHVPGFVEDYLANFEAYNVDNAEIIIIGDRKTPHEATQTLLKRLNAHRDDVSYFDVTGQEKWLTRYPKLAKMVPYDSDNRRNLGYIMALENGSEVIISIDDDNFPTEENFVMAHSIVGETVQLPTIGASNSWFNVCSLLKNDKGIEIYPRGFPYSKRFESNKITRRESGGKVALNLGLWKHYPDIDAMSHLTLAVKTLGFASDTRRIMLDRYVFSPLNSQNTAVSREAMAAYYNIVMGEEIQGLRIDRYNDIWQGYFAKKIVDVMNERVTVGIPLSEHRRNMHDLMRDMKSEFWGMIITERIVEWIATVKIQEHRSYVDAYCELAEALYRDAALIADTGVIRRYLRKIARNMQFWTDVYEEAVG